MEHYAGYGKCVDSVAGRKGKRKILERIVLVVILNRVGEIDHIGGIGQHRVAELHCHLAPT